MPHVHAPKVIPEFKVPGKPLGRSLVVHSQSNLKFPVRSLLTPAPRTSKVWWHRGIFNQGSDSDCVLESSSAACLSAPFRNHLSTAQRADLTDHQKRMVLYRHAQTLDPWVGEAYDGTSTDAGFKALRDGGYIKEWRWCLGNNTDLSALDDVLDTLSQHGPVVIGINWYDSYDKPGYGGRLRRSPNASVRGGHALEVNAVNFRQRKVRGPQSWGPDWGDHGFWEMDFKTLEMALSEDGEACTAVFE